MLRPALLVVIVMASAQGQWMLQDSHSTASLRGVHSVGNGVVWASGTNSTVLRTTDNGQTWNTCAIPPGAEKLDFRGIHGFDAKTAAIMSSGTGSLSRIYRTTDGCATWSLVFTNPDSDGFWDAMRFSGPDLGILIGDQVAGHFPVFISRDGGTTWQRKDVGVRASGKNQSIFAASNTSLILEPEHRKFFFITGGGLTSFIDVNLQSLEAQFTDVPIASGASAGGFSIGSRIEGRVNLVVVAVGGDYKSPNETAGTAATLIYDRQGTGHWRASDKPPHGYRSAVAFNSANRTWIAVGPNGTDTSTDNGRTWHSATPSDATDDRDWNALSLPFAVGSKGRIGKLK